MVPAVHQPESLTAYLRQHLNLTPDFAAGQLSVEQIADIALLATAHSAHYAATSHLLSLVAGLPIPSDEPKDFWFQLWQASGTPVLMPTNVKGQILRALDGDGAGLADQLLTAMTDMNSEERTAAAALIGQHLADHAGLPENEGPGLGELWLRDVDITAWRLLYADRTRPTWESQTAFRNGWKNV
ncbi:hypothetical protein [Streptomyces sp. NPDC002133]|uniref:hypothetical protein n=1 Tax=Streptomyces sp. NPDC002133 TaxID=3154409 RepID=UPI0033290125